MERPRRVWKGGGERSVQVGGAGQAGHSLTCSRGFRMHSPSVPYGAADKRESHWCWGCACSGGVVAPQHWGGTWAWLGQLQVWSPVQKGREQPDWLILAKIEGSLPTHLKPS